MISRTVRWIFPTFLKRRTRELHTWYITEDEDPRLGKLFKGNFQEVRLGGTKAHVVPTPYERCGKYMEFIAW
jgi:hypothetical protein